MISFHNPPDFETAELKFLPIPALDLARLDPVDPDDPFPPAPSPRPRGPHLGLTPPVTPRPRHKAHRLTLGERTVVVALLLTCALALVALMIVALLAGRPAPAAPLEQLPTAPTSSAVSTPVSGAAGAVGSLPSPSPAPTPTR